MGAIQDRWHRLLELQKKYPKMALAIKIYDLSHKISNSWTDDENYVGTLFTELDELLRQL